MTARYHIVVNESESKNAKAALERLGIDPDIVVLSSSTEPSIHHFLFSADAYEIMYVKFCCNIVECINTDDYMKQLSMSS